MENTPGYRLPVSQRGEMRETIGPVIKENELSEHLAGVDVIITVGDVVTETCLDNGYRPDVLVIDGRTRRGEYHDLELSGYEIVWVKSPAGEITPELWDAVTDAIERSDVAIIVDGEDDLASLPAITSAPDGAVVLYGVPKIGIAVVVVGDRAREAVKDALATFESY